LFGLGFFRGGEVCLLVVLSVPYIDTPGRFQGTICSAGAALAQSLLPPSFPEALMRCSPAVMAYSFPGQN